MTQTNPTRRRHMIISSIIVIFAVLLLGLLIKGLKLNPQHVASTLIDKPAHSFTAQLLQGSSWLRGASDPQTIRFEELKGKPIVLNFWASWCVSCREEAQFFETFWQRHRESDVLVIGIAIQDTPEAALEFAKTFGKTYPLGLDVSGKSEHGLWRLRRSRNVLYRPFGSDQTQRNGTHVCPATRRKAYPH